MKTAAFLTEAYESDLQVSKDYHYSIRDAHYIMWH